MKKLLILLLPIVFFACKKELPVKQEDKILVLEADDFGINKGLRKPTTNPGKGHKPKDTVVIPPPTEPPPPYYGARIFYVEFNGCQVNSVWGNFYALPSNIPEDQQQRIIDTVSGGYYEFQNFIVTKDKSLFDNTPELYRHKIVVTPTHDFYGNGAGGVAYRGSFGTGVESFAFTDLLFNVEKWIERTIRHEGGHALGLPHRYYTEAELSGDVLNIMAIFPFNATKVIWESQAPDATGFMWDQYSVIRATIAK